jgi:curved DNA-binding protein CbpA
MVQQNLALADLALRLYREKSQTLPVILSHELETGFSVLLHIASGDAAWLNEARSDLGATKSELKAAAMDFIERFAFKGSGDPYQVLGLSPLAPTSDVKVHYRLMMRLFHPDRTSFNPKRARDYAALINQAMNRIENKDQKAEPLRQTTRGPIDIPPDRPSRFRPDSSFKKGLRSIILNYGLFFLAATLGISLYLIELKQQSQPKILFEEGISSIKEAHQPLNHPGEMAREAYDSDKDHPKTASIKSEDTLLLEIPIQSPIKVEEVRTLDEDAAPLSLPKSLIKKMATEKVRPPLDLKATDIKLIRIKPTPIESPASDKPTMEAKATQAIDDMKPLMDEPIKKPPAEKIFSLQDMRSLTYGFVSAYNDGQVEAIMQLMADNVKTETMLNKTELRNAYAQFFANTVKREMVLRNLQFSELPTSIKAKTHYQVKLFEVNQKEPKMVFGELEIEGALDQALPKIISLYNRTLP